MSRYIDADKLKEMVDRQYKYCHGYTGTKKDIYREALLAVKSAIHCQSVSNDLQEVVRCNDCKYHHDNLMCDKHSTIMKDSDFCSYAIKDAV